MAATEGSRRVDVLAKPKSLPEGFFEDRRSVYWVDRLPGSGSEATPRLEELAAPKNAHTYYNGDRPTPIWPVSDGAKTAEATPRLAQLSTSKTLPGEYRHERSPYTTIPEAAKQASASPRVEQLSAPKALRLRSTDEPADTLPLGEFSEPIVPVTDGSQKARCSARVDALSEHKAASKQYHGERPVQWPVPDNVKNASATARLQQLARPKSGRLKTDDYDPYTVTNGARKARATPRVEELSTPLPRKVRSKKN